MELEIFKSLDNYFQVNQQQDQLEKTINEIRIKGISLFDRVSHPYHFTASAWIVDKAKQNTLLIFHKKLQMWIQPGGHADGETDLSNVAYKEAVEETGIKSLRLVSNEIFDFDITPIPAHKDTAAHSHLDARYVIEADINEQIMESDETAGAKWFSIETISDIINDEGILRMAKKITQ